MEKEKLIIVNGAQGSGKTTVTDYIRNKLNYTNLYRLSGTSDPSIQGKNKTIKMYENLLLYLKNMEGLSINLLFDQIFITEEVYDRLGKKEYSFTKEYNYFMDKLSNLNYDIYIITLYLSKEDDYIKRLDRPGKHDVKYSLYNKENSILQQKVYLEIANEIKEKYNNINIINIDNSNEEKIVKKEIDEILNL